MAQKKAKKVAREARKWIETFAKLLRAAAEFWNAVDGE